MRYLRVSNNKTKSWFSFKIKFGFEGFGKIMQFGSDQVKALKKRRFLQRSSVGQWIKLEILDYLIKLWSMEEKVSESTSNLGFIRLDWYISFVFYFFKIRLISLSQFEFELKADVSIEMLNGERPKKSLCTLSIYLSIYLFYFLLANCWIHRLCDQYVWIKKL